MCLIAFATGVSEEYPFILFGNRDVFVDRGFEALSLDVSSSSVLCSIDGPTNGTWMGVNTETRQMCALTNIGGRGGRKGSRGQMVMRILEKCSSPLDILKESISKNKEMPGFNFISASLDFPPSSSSSPPPSSSSSSSSPSIPPGTVLYTSNYFPDDDREWDSLKSGEVHCMGNDLLEDDFVRADSVKNSVKTFLSIAKSFGDMVQPEAMRDGLASIFCERFDIFGEDISLVNFFGKFFKISKKRRRQPGLTTTLYLFPLLLLSLLPLFYFLLPLPLSTIFATSLLFSTLLSFSLGVAHHFLMQSPYISLPGFSPSTTWATVSQTCILVDKNNNIYYYYRRTDGLRRKHFQLGGKGGKGGDIYSWQCEKIEAKK